MNAAKPSVTTVLLRRRAGALKRHLRAAARGDDVGVHQTRVACRRLREAIPVLTAGIKASKAGRAQRKVRRLTRALGVVRELDVSLALLDELAARDTLPRLALEEVRARVLKEQEHRRELMLKRFAHVDIEKLDRRIAAVADVVQGSGSTAWREKLATRLLRRAKATAAAVREAGHMYAPEHLHAVRISVKKLRYAMELAADARIRGAAAHVSTLRRAQDALGRLHDLQILQSHVAAVQASPVSETPPDHGLDLVARRLEEECRHLHARYVALIPALQALFQETRQVVVPQVTVRRSRSRPPVKMALTSGRRQSSGQLARPAGQRA